MCREENVDFVLAVGRQRHRLFQLHAAGAVYEGDFWDFYQGKLVEHALPIGTVLTIAAAGSEEARTLSSPWRTAC